MQNRTVREGQEEKDRMKSDRQNRKADRPVRTGQADRNTQNRTGRTGHAEKDTLKRTC
jgi:hypothetical protein